MGKREREKIEGKKKERGGCGAYVKSRLPFTSSWTSHRLPMVTLQSSTQRRQKKKRENSS